jgi:very-short-patch-repair endonuclease
LPVPEVNVEVFDPTGRFLARADLYFRLARLLVEYDGDQHRRDAGQFAHDVRRLSDLAAHGYLVLRFTSADHFGQPERVISRWRQRYGSGRTSRDHAQMCTAHLGR